MATEIDNCYIVKLKGVWSCNVRVWAPTEEDADRIARDAVRNDEVNIELSVEPSEVELAEDGYVG